MSPNFLFILATRNAHKVEEIRALLRSEFRFLTLEDFPSAPDVIENADTFRGNATKKSVELANWLAGSEHLKSQQEKCANIFVLADDSGLEVDALNGAPGVFSARFAALDSGQKGNSSDAENNKKLLRLLEKVPLEKRTARFRCVIALTPIIFPANETASPACFADEAELRREIFEGACEGRIAFVASGQGGFGYDPLFIPSGFENSFAELGHAEKNKISHRAKALSKLCERFL